MATYFSSTATADLALLPSGIRAHSDLADVAAYAEADVIGAYTYDADVVTGWGGSLDAGIVSLGDGTVVCLRGYAIDAASASAALALALKREIADVIRHRLALWRKEPNLVSEGGKTTSKSYRSDSESSWPPTFGKWLRPFDTRPVSYNL
jgi:hypothetical protein